MPVLATDFTVAITSPLEGSALNTYLPLSFVITATAPSNADTLAAGTFTVNLFDYGTTTPNAGILPTAARSQVITFADYPLVNKKAYIEAPLPISSQYGNAITVQCIYDDGETEKTFTLTTYIGYAIATANFTATDSPTLTGFYLNDASTFSSDPTSDQQISDYATGNSITVKFLDGNENPTIYTNTSYVPQSTAQSFFVDTSSYGDGVYEVTWILNGDGTDYPTGTKHVKIANVLHIPRWECAINKAVWENPCDCGCEEDQPVCVSGLAQQQMNLAYMPTLLTESPAGSGIFIGEPGSVKKAMEYIASANDWANANGCNC